MIAPRPGGQAESRPRDPPSRRLCRTSDPIWPRSRFAPTTATSSRYEDAAHGRVGRDLESRRGLRDGATGWLQRQDHVGNPGVAVLGDPKARVLEHPKHLRVVAEHVGVEDADVLMTGPIGQPFEETHANPQSMPRIVDREGDLGPVELLLAPRAGRDADDVAISSAISVVVLAGFEAISLATSVVVTSPTEKNLEYRLSGESRSLRSGARRSRPSGEKAGGAT